MRDFLKGPLFLIVLMLFVLVGCQDSKVEKEEGTSASETTTSEKSELKVALNAAPPTLDQPMDTATITRDTGRLIFETLMTTDEAFKPVPMLAESVKTKDNQTYTFKLREGILFHNGKEMLAEDVVASMERWLDKSSITGEIFNDAVFEATDDYTVVLTLTQPSTLALDTMASAKQAAAIMPKEIVDEAPPEGVKEYIGTGPYQFVDWKQDQYIHLTKYDAYQPVDDEPSGLAGKKEALIEDIYFYIVTDPSTRLAGLQTGEYDIVYDLPSDTYGQIKEDPNLEPHVVTGSDYVFFYNNVQGIASNFKFRQAINTALDMDEILMAVSESEELVWLHSGYMNKEIEEWQTDAGSEFYNLKDQEKAKEILDEIGYDGEEFKMATTRDYESLYHASVVIQEQLKQIGINVKLDVYDWPTLGEVHDHQPENWDAFVMGFSQVSTPSQLLSISSDFAGGVNDEKINELLKAIETAETREKALKLWEELQQYSWEEHLPVSIIGGAGGLFGASKSVKNLSVFSGPIYWNVSLDVE